MSDLTTCPNCGASPDPKDRGRFWRRHPDKCQAHAQSEEERKNFTAQFAAGTRCVDDQEGGPVAPKSVLGPKRVSLV